MSVPCEARLVVTAAPTLRRSARTAARLENHLPKLRGFRNSEVRMEIAGYLGVRPAAELGLLRAARDVLAAVIAEEPPGEYERIFHKAISPVQTRKKA